MKFGKRSLEISSKRCTSQKVNQLSTGLKMSLKSQNDDVRTDCQYENLAEHIAQLVMQGAHTL